MFYIFLQYKQGYGEKDFRGFRNEEALLSFLLKSGKGLLIHKIFEVSKEYKIGLIELPQLKEKKRGRPPRKKNQPTSAALRDQFANYGYHPKCKKCNLLKECESPQYDAPGLTDFQCEKNKEAL